MQTAGGILLPDTGKKLNEGEVIAAGPGAISRDGKTLPMHVKVRPSSFAPIANSFCPLPSPRLGR